MASPCMSFSERGYRPDRIVAPRLELTRGWGLFRSASAVACSFALSVVFTRTALAQTSYPMLMQVYPAGIQRGTTTDVTVTGARNFAGAYKVLFQGAGLSAEVIPPVQAQEK